MKSQKRKLVGLHVLVSIRELRMSDATQKRRGLEPRVLYLLDKWLFVIDAHVFSVDVQRSGYVVRVVGNPR